MEAVSNAAFAVRCVLTKNPTLDGILGSYSLGMVLVLGEDNEVAAIVAKPYTETFEIASTSHVQMELLTARI